MFPGTVVAGSAIPCRFQDNAHNEQQNRHYIDVLSGLGVRERIVALQSTPVGRYSTGIDFDVRHLYRAALSGRNAVWETVAD